MLQFADDTCLIGKDSAACQSLINKTNQWLQWSGMKAKVPKCHSVAINSSSGKAFDPHLILNQQEIPLIDNKTIKFLGLTIQFPCSINQAKTNVIDNLERLLKLTDSSSISRQQKLRIFKLGICPRLTWQLLIHNFPITWIKTQLQLKVWSGLAKSANTALLFLPLSNGGLGIPSITVLYKKLQSSKQCQLLTSNDPCVRYIAEKNIEAEESSQRKKFKPALSVRNILSIRPSQTRRQLTRSVKTSITTSDTQQMKDHLLSLPKQGSFLANAQDNNQALWSKVIPTLPEQTFKFILNASLDTLPTNHNLFLWKKRSSPICSLCNKSNQSLLHVLNSCATALHLRRYNPCHDSVLEKIGSFISEHLQATETIIVDRVIQNMVFL